MLDQDGRCWRVPAVYVCSLVCSTAADCLRAVGCWGFGQLRCTRRLTYNGSECVVLPFSSAIAFERSLVRLLASAWPSLSPPLFLLLFLSSPLVATLMLCSGVAWTKGLCCVPLARAGITSQVKSLVPPPRTTVLGQRRPEGPITVRAGECRPPVSAPQRLSLLAFLGVLGPVGLVWKRHAVLH